jgi:hypothetical protein
MAERMRRRLGDESRSLVLWRRVPRPPVAQWIEQRVSRLGGKRPSDSALLGPSAARAQRVVSARGSTWQGSGLFLVR